MNGERHICPQCRKAIVTFTKEGFYCEDCGFRAVIFDPYNHLKKKKKEMERWEQTPKEQREYENKPCITCEFLEICEFNTRTMGRKRRCMIEV